MNSKAASPKRRRQRGVILTDAGLSRFLSAKVDAEHTDNGGQRYTLEALSELTAIGIDTLTKVLGCEMRVDKQTLKCCFRAFGLDLQPDDYYKPTSQAAVPALEVPLATAFSPALPGGLLPIDSSLYVQRLKAQADSFAAIDQPGALIRIKGARRTGKTSLMARLAQQAQQRGYQPVLISFQLADKPVLQNLDQLLQWFCASVGLELGLAPKMETYWDSLFGSKVSCKIYFEQYLLSSSDRPIILMLDDVDRLFRDVEIADEFFGLLRTWYEDAKVSDVWKQLRIVIAQSSEVYIPLNINKSPFNVGLAIPLSPFTPADVQTLVAAYGLEQSVPEATALCQLVRGQVYLTHLAIDYVWRTAATLAEVLHNPLGVHVFLPYLQHQLREVQQQPELTQALSYLLAKQSVPPDLLTSVYQLQSMGLIVLDDDGPRIACDLFERYFPETLAVEHVPSDVSSFATVP